MRYAPPMRGIPIAIALLVTAALSAQSANSEKDAVLKAVQTFFDTMAAKDVEGARKILQPQGRFHAMRMRDGKPDVRAFSNEEYFADLQASKQRMRERIWNPDVRINGLIATVWAPYDFWIDGKLSHCGIDAFDLIRTEEGWKIAGGVYTLEGNCPASPLGPLKPE
jgi:Putative lumazine-binding